MEVISLVETGTSYDLIINIASELAPFLAKHGHIDNIHLIDSRFDFYNIWIRQYPGLKSGDICWAINDYVVLRPGKIKIAIHRTKLFASLDEIRHVDQLYKTFMQAKSSPGPRNDTHMRVDRTREHYIITRAFYEFIKYYDAKFVVSGDQDRLGRAFTTIWTESLAPLVAPDGTKLPDGSDPGDKKPDMDLRIECPDPSTRQSVLEKLQILLIVFRESRAVEYY